MKEKPMKQVKEIPRTVFPFMLYFLSPYKLFVSLFLLCAIISGLYGVINSNLLKIIIDLLEKQPDTTTLLSFVFWPAILFIINFEVHNLTWRGIAYINGKVQPIIKNNIISQTFDYVCRHSHQFFQDNLAGRVSNNIHILANNMERAMNEISMHIIRGIVLLIGSLISMYFVHPYFFLGFFWVGQYIFPGQFNYF